MNKEFRQIRIDSNAEARTISGYAAVFNSESNDLGFYETIAPGAITEDTIIRSDVVATLNHDPEKVLARSKYGKGTLQLNVDERGLKYEYEAPNTTLGNDLREMLKRGDIDAASFAFTVSQEEGAQKWEKRDGKYYRTIYKIDKLFDVAAVYYPAYSAASTELRAQQEAYDIEMRKLDEEETDNGNNANDANGGDAAGASNNTGSAKDSKEDRQEEEVNTPDDENKENDDKSRDDSTNGDNNDSANADSNETDDKEVNPSDDKEDKQEEEVNPSDDENKENDDDKEVNDDESRSNDDKNTKEKKMTEKRFSLIDAINDVANNRSLDSVASKVNELGTSEMRASGLSFGGQIQIPMTELRGNVTVAAEGEDVVATDLFDIVGPLRAQNVLMQAGAKFLTGLVGDVQIPIMSATNVNWAEETAAASDGAGTFSNVTLSPKRLTAYVNISKQLLNQNSVDVDNMIRQDIIRAISSKLESTILGNAAGSTTQPAGIFYNVTPTKVTGMAGIAEVEGVVEDANVYGDLMWVINPKFKADLRTMAKGSNIAQSLYENGEIDGTGALSTGNVGEKLGVYGDFSQLAIGQWGAIDLTVDPYTQAKNGMIVLVVNAYFDAKVVRPEAFGFATTNAK